MAEDSTARLRGWGIGAVARLTGLPVHQLRRYHEKDWLPASEVDPFTGYRRYTWQDLRRARLLAALRLCGMPVEQAAEALDDRARVLRHVRDVEGAVRTIRELLPPERPGRVRRVVLATETVAVVRVAAAAGEETAPALARSVGAVQARVAAERGMAVTELPRADRDDLPGGPVAVRAEDDVEIALPWPDAAGPPPAGSVRRVWPGCEAQACEVDGTTDLGTAQRLVRAELDALHRVLPVFGMRSVLGPDLARHVLVAPFVRL